jgi:enoyl-CoA hydratase/carnithine racemase
MASELRDVALLVNNDEAIRVVVLTGKGRHFSSGLWSSPKLSNYPATPLQAAATITQIQVPVIAAINGDAVGQGLELALAADIRIAARGAHFGLPHLCKGLLPWDGGTQRLPRLIGRSKALELLLTGENIDVYEAERIGLINRVEDLGNLNSVVDKIAIHIAEAAPIAARYIKEAVTEGVDMPLDHGLRLEADLSILLHTTKDRSEGIQSFLERRTARFGGK